MRRIVRAFGLVAVVTLGGSSAHAMVSQQASGQKWYTIAQVVGMDRGLSYEAVESSRVSTRRQELIVEYQKAVLAWRKTKKGARPYMPSVVALKQVRGQEEATKYIAELEAKHSVVMVRDMDGKTTYESVQTIALTRRKAQLDAKYEKALEEYEAEKRAAAPDPGGVFARKRPRKPSMIVVQRDLKDKMTADAAVAKLTGKKS